MVRCAPDGHFYLAETSGRSASGTMKTHQVKAKAPYDSHVFLFFLKNPPVRIPAGVLRDPQFVFSRNVPPEAIHLGRALPLTDHQDRPHVPVSKTGPSRPCAYFINVIGATAVGRSPATDLGRHETTGFDRSCRAASTAERSFSSISRLNDSIH